MDFFTFILQVCLNNSESVEKTSVIGLTKFSNLNMAENCHHPEVLEENMFFENYFFCKPDDRDLFFY